MRPEALINKAAGDAKDNTHNFGAAVKARLDEFNETAKRARPHKYRVQSKPRGQSIATGKMRVTGISRYLRIAQGYCSQRLNAIIGYKKEGLLEK